MTVSSSSVLQAHAPWTSEEQRILDSLDSPAKISRFLDKLAYDARDETISPRRVLRERRAHCFSGAIFAAAALRNLGYAPLIVDQRAVNDDDHIIAVYRKDGCWGAIAKSNFTTLRAREPVYRSVRELIMSYFDFYFNTAGEMTLREYSRPFNLKRFDKDDWMTSEKDLSYIGRELDKTRHVRVASPAQVRRYGVAGAQLVKASLLGANTKGLFRPKARQNRH
jgi:hypothetical protein